MTFQQQRYTVEEGAGAYRGRWLVLNKERERITDEATEAQAQATAAKCAKNAREYDRHQEKYDRGNFWTAPNRMIYRHE